MVMNHTYAAVEPGRVEIDAMQGAAVIEFGAPWCPHCVAVQPLLSSAIASHPDVVHIKIEDGKGKPLGRSYRVKLWPTLIFLKNGQEMARLVRPADSAEIRNAFAEIDA